MSKTLKGRFGIFITAAIGIYNRKKAANGAMITVKKECKCITNQWYGSYLEFGIKRGVMLPSTGHGIRPLDRNTIHRNVLT